MATEEPRKHEKLESIVRLTAPPSKSGYKWYRFNVLDRITKRGSFKDPLASEQTTLYRIEIGSSSPNTAKYVVKSYWSRTNKEDDGADDSYDDEIENVNAARRSYKLAKYVPELYSTVHTYDPKCYQFDRMIISLDYGKYEICGNDADLQLVFADFKEVYGLKRIPIPLRQNIVYKHHGHVKIVDWDARERTSFTVWKRGLDTFQSRHKVDSESLWVMLPANDVARMQLKDIDVFSHEQMMQYGEKRLRNEAERILNEKIQLCNSKIRAAEKKIQELKKEKTFGDVQM